MDEMTQAPQHPGWLLDFDLKIEELMRFNRVACRNSQSWLIQIMLLFVCAYFAGEISTQLGYGSGEDTKGLFLSIAIMAALYVFTMKLYSKIFYRNHWPEDSAALAQRRMSITVECVSTEQAYSSDIVQWPGITRIIPDETAVYLMLGSGMGYTIPYRVLPSDVTPSEFLRVLRSFKECARA